jgi:hypothetical protein
VKIPCRDRKEERELGHWLPGIDHLEEMVDKPIRVKAGVLSALQRDLARPRTPSD